MQNKKSKGINCGERLRALSSVGSPHSMRVDEEMNSRSLLAIKRKARTVVGRGKNLLSDPGPELRLLIGRDKEKDKGECSRRDKQCMK